jgi:hypothetical protein
MTFVNSFSPSSQSKDRTSQSTSSSVMLDAICSIIWLEQLLKISTHHFFTDSAFESCDNFSFAFIFYTGVQLHPAGRKATQGPAEISTCCGQFAMVILSNARCHETVHVMTSAVILCTTGAFSFPSISRKIPRPSAFASPLEIPNCSGRYLHTSAHLFDPRRHRPLDNKVNAFERQTSLSGVQTLVSSNSQDKYKPRKLSVAPMMDWTDRFDRYFLRTMSKHTWLYTEMVTTGAIIFGDQVFSP